MTGTSVFSLLGKLAIDGVDESKKALDDVSKTGEDTKNKLNVSFNDIATKAGEMGKKMALGLAGVTTAAIAAVEGTREFRQDLGKLKATFGEGTDGLGVKAGTEAFKELFAVLGEDDTAIEAANHLGVMVDSEEKLFEWTNILTGVYATFGDSLPLEGLAEAANETARVGQVTGPLADALNWLGISEDEFNAKLEKTNNTAEREALIRETLTGLYGAAADEYKKVNSGVMENNKSQADLNLKMADTAAKIEPLITKGKEFIADVLEKAQPLINWVVENFDLIAPIILTVVGALTLFSATMGIVNAVMAASPVTWIVLGIVAAIAALVAIIVLVVKHWEQIKETASNVWNGIKEIWGKVAEWFKTNITDPIVSFFQDLWAGIQAVWDGIVLGIQIFIGLVASIFDAAFQIITLPFRLIWENCKEYVFAAFEWIKEKIQNAIDWIKSIVQKGFNLVNKYIVEPINNAKDKVINTFLMIKDKIDYYITLAKSIVQKTFNTIKEKITTPINNAKNKVIEVFNNIKNSISEKINSAKDTVTNTFNKIKTAITSPIEKARDIVKGVVDKIKGFFNFKVSLPKIKLPHFSIKPKGWELGDLLKGKIPKLGIDWYAKAVRNPMLLERPTAFGLSPNGNIRVGGEAGSEIVGGTNTIMGMISNAVSSNNGGIEDKLDKLIYLFSNLTQVMSNQQVVLSTGELVGALTNPLDKSLGQLADDRRRGR